MKKILSAIIFFTVLGCMICGASASELLEVKPVINGNDVSINISCDSAMTYTYYKVPGHSMAIVDIAGADPEKIEPLIVVNKGAITNISIDTVQISDVAISRITFNLVSELDISVSASSDKKHLAVTFGHKKTLDKPEIKSEQKPKSEPTPAPVPPATAAAPPLNSLTAPAANSTTAPASPPVKRITKLEPVVPAEVATKRPSTLKIGKVVLGTSHIEIHANQPVTEYKTMRLSGPDRLVIDIACQETDQKTRSVAIHKFGVAKIRIGVTPTNIRIVVDSSMIGFPAHTIATSDSGLRLNFK